jgi:hypothetical protein
MMVGKRRRGSSCEVASELLTHPLQHLAEAEGGGSSHLGSGRISDPAWRTSAYEHGRAIARGGAAANTSATQPLPDLLAQLVDDVARAPDRITDEQFEALYTAGYSAEVLCELALAAALGAGVERRTTGMEAIDAWESGFTDPRGAAR